MLKSLIIIGSKKETVEFLTIENITLAIAVYGAIVATIKIVYDYYVKSRRFKVQVSRGFGIQGKNVGPQMLIISAINTGFSDITLTSAGLILPGSKFLTQVEPTSNVVFPFTLEAGKPCSIYKGRRALAFELKKQGYSGKVKLRGFYRSATGTTVKSKKFVFDTESIPPPGE
jgi:hypothetical protein